MRHNANKTKYCQKSITINSNRGKKKKSHTHTCKENVGKVLFWNLEGQRGHTEFKATVENSLREAALELSRLLSAG